MAVMTIVDRILSGLPGSLGRNVSSAYSAFERATCTDVKPPPSATPGDYGDRKSALVGKSIPASGDGSAATKAAGHVESGTVAEIHAIAEKQKKKDSQAAAKGVHPEHERAEVKAWEHVQRKLAHPVTVKAGSAAIMRLLSFPLTPHPEVVAEKLAAQMDWSKIAAAVDADGVGPGAHPGVSAAGINAVMRLVSFPLTPHPDKLAEIMATKTASVGDEQIVDGLAYAFMESLFAGARKHAERNPSQPKKEHEEGAESVTHTPVQGVEA